MKKENKETKKEKKPLTAIERFNAVQEINKEASRVPWDVWTIFPGQLSGDGKSSFAKYGIEVNGDQICMGGDFVSIEQVKSALEYLTDQFGGKVKWSK